MQKTLTRHGNSLAIVIERPILELLNADASTVFDVSTDGTALVLTPIRDKDSATAVHSAIEKVGKRYAKSFEELAK